MCFTARDRAVAMASTPRTGDRVPLTPTSYYADTAVRARMLESCGGSPATPPTAAYIALLGRGSDRVLSWDHAVRLPAAALPQAWARGCDVSRSLWDTRDLIFLFELDYLNVDHPEEPFLNPAGALLKVEPTYRAAATFFKRTGVPLQPLVSGRGYHFLGRIPLTHPLVNQLAEIAPGAPGWLSSHAARRPAGIRAALPIRQARAAEGLNLLLEFAAHRVLEPARRTSPIPVVFNGTVVGRGLRGRECVSIDFSHAGDPLDVRHVRTAFSTYRWHQQRPDIFGAEASTLPALAVVPRTSLSLMPVLEAGRDLDTVRRLARRRSGRLPDVAGGMTRLLAEYRRSRLCVFHRAFHAGLRQRDDRPPARRPPGLLPCVAAALDQPNDLLLKPAFVQHLVRALLARGWTAPDIAAVISVEYETDHDWGRRWRWMDPTTRAAFDVRVFAGLVATGADTLTDFNCVSAQEKGLCPMTGCTHDLRLERDRLIARQGA